MVKPNELPCIEALEEYYSYCKESGLVTLKKRTAQRADEGAVVGSLKGDGYLVTMFKGKHIYVHRLAYKLATKEEPPSNIHHKNHDRSDNRWSNLEPSSYSHNAGLRITSLGYIKKRRKYVAYITTEGVSTELKYCNCPTAARVRYLQEKISLGFDVSAMLNEPHLKS